MQEYLGIHNCLRFRGPRNNLKAKEALECVPKIWCLLLYQTTNEYVYSKRHQLLHSNAASFLTVAG